MTENEKTTATAETIGTAELTDTAELTVTKARSGLSTRSLTLCAMFVALTAVCSQIAIPLPPVPLNLGLFAVYLAGALLGPRLGMISQLAFVLLGAVGVPVFAGFRGGLSALVGPTGGYLLGYLVVAWLVGLLVHNKGGFWQLVGAMALGTVLCYTLGTAWFMVLTGQTLVTSLSLCVLPFLPGDAAKALCAAFLTLRLRAPLRAYLC